MNYIMCICDILSICRWFRLGRNACILFPCILHIVTYWNWVPNTEYRNTVIQYNVICCNARQYSRLCMNGMVRCPRSYHFDSFTFGMFGLDALTYGLLRWSSNRFIVFDVGICSQNEILFPASPFSSYAIIVHIVCRMRMFIIYAYLYFSNRNGDSFIIAN